jgi:hypothetical protein
MKMKKKDELDQSISIDRRDNPLFFLSKADKIIMEV